MPTGKQLLPAALLLLGTGALSPAGLVQAAPAKPAKPAAAPAADEGKPVDVAAVKDKLQIVTDGKGHYVAFGPVPMQSESVLFYGDGKVFWKQRVSGGGAQGDYQFTRRFWEPRATHSEGGDFGLLEKKYTVSCSPRDTEMKLVPAAETKAMLGAAKFYDVRWKWQAHFIARDDRANYYYVDKAREPADSKIFRLWVGPKGSLKQQRMTNVVSDTEGEIFATKTGSLRLITGKSEWTWLEGDKTIKLTRVPVDINLPLIYTELGVYNGERLGTPCDDL